MQQLKISWRHILVLKIIKNFIKFTYRINVKYSNQRLVAELMEIINDYY